MKCKDPQQTKKAMKDAMISLLLEKKFEEISIKDITDKAEVHRSTFYAYYTCKGDVIDEIEKDFIDTLPVFQSAKKEDILSSFSEFVELIKSNVNIVRAVRNSGIAPTFGSVLVSRVMERYKLIFHANDKCLEEAAYIFCINGIQGIINNWIDKGCIESIDTIASISIRLAFNTVGLSSDISV